MNSLPQYDLCLADGTCWVIAAGDEGASPVVDVFARAMSLPEHASPGRFLWVVSEERMTQMHKGEDDLFHILNPAAGSGVYFEQLHGLSYAIACQVLSNGGILLHGALAEYVAPIATIQGKCEGVGVIMAAPSGTGKTTASNRLRLPWTSLCDDLTLVVRDAQGNYWAHPWPTWSQFWYGRPGGPWNTPRAVPLSAIFLLVRNQHDYTEKVGSGRSVSLLLEIAKQAVHAKEKRQKMSRIRTLRLMRFNNLCAITKIIPLRILYFSADGMFWVEMEKALQASSLERRRECTQPV